jgi:low affinity Fe/Cu permease
MGNVLNISILDGMTFDLKINKIIRSVELDGNYYHLFLLRNVSEYQYQIYDLLSSSDKNDKNNLNDNYYIHENSQGPEILDSVESNKRYTFRTEHHIYELVKFSSRTKNKIIRVQEASLEERNKEIQWIRSNMQIKVKPSAMNYHNFSSMLEISRK